MDALVAVRRRIATALTDGAMHVETRLGAVVLRPHQVDAVGRLRAALDTHGGALLADAPGLGKTYVALAIVRDLGGAVVAGPAGLRAQWMRSATAAGVRIRWCSLETLSRRRVQDDAPLLVIDEAHHLRNPATRRYAHAAALAAGKRVLLLTATPVHNRPADGAALLALFLGADASSATGQAQAPLIVRRAADPSLLPRRGATRELRVAPSEDFSASLRRLPPPLPAADGREAAMLVQLTLAHAWASSVAALDAALRRAVLRAAALGDALAAGCWPSRRELLAWGRDEESSQLAFPALVAAPARANVDDARGRLARHTTALDTLRRAVAPARHADAEARAAALRGVMEAHPRATILAFSRYAATIDALWRALHREAGVVAITARGVRSAGGGLRRHDVLAALGADTAADVRAPLRLVLSTDLLGEGLDLRAASVVVHLDQPWTPALLDQREGRAARLSSVHAQVAVYAMRPPPGAESVLAMAARLRAKRRAMHTATAPGDAREALLAAVRPWMADATGDTANGAANDATVAACVADFDGWVAVVRDARRRTRVIAGGPDAPVREDDDLLRHIIGRVALAPPCAPCPCAGRAARDAIRRWLRADASATLAGAVIGTTAAHAALARRLDAALRNTPLHQRADLQPRILAARARAAAMRGAGAERALALAARCAGLEEMLDAVGRIGVLPTVMPAPSREPRLLALLLIRARRAVSPAASPVAPR